MSKIKWKKKMFALLGIGLVMLGSLVLLSNVAFADLSARSLQVEDLPEDAMIIADRYVETDDTSHPLSLAKSPDGSPDAPESQQILYKYKAAYSFSAFTPDRSVFIANFTYQYSDNFAADEAAKLMIENVQTWPTYMHELPVNIEQDKADSLYGQAFALAGSEGDSVFWFIGVQDNTMSLVIVNGFDNRSVNDVFNSVVQNLLTRLVE